MTTITKTNNIENSDTQNVNNFLSVNDISNIVQTISQNAISCLGLPVSDTTLLNLLVGNSGVYSSLPRWLRFAFNSNNKSIVIKKGTIIKLENSFYSWDNDTSYDLSSFITEVGKDYYIILTVINNNKTIVASTSKNFSSTPFKIIGRCTTLCADVGNINMTVPAIPNCGLTSSDYYQVKSYVYEEDPDFYNFYHMPITSVLTQDYYDVVTCKHPLSNFNAGDILPESVFCDSFKPLCSVEDSVVYDKDTNTVIDVYLQSGVGINTRSEYNKEHTVNRQPLNHQEDYRLVGKRLLSENEFTSAAIGSNEQSSIIEQTDKNVVGGHYDTENRRMISAIGCEEMCGYLWQCLGVFMSQPSIDLTISDGHGSFGSEFGTLCILLAGGNWNNGTWCGSRCRITYVPRSCVSNTCGGRGASRILIGRQVF